MVEVNMASNGELIKQSEREQKCVVSMSCKNRKRLSDWYRDNASAPSVPFNFGCQNRLFGFLR